MNLLVGRKVDSVATPIHPPKSIDLAMLKLTNVGEISHKKKKLLCLRIGTGFDEYNGEDSVIREGNSETLNESINGEITSRKRGDHDGQR